MNGRLIERRTSETIVEVTVRVAVDHGFHGADRHWAEFLDTVSQAIEDRPGLELVEDDEATNTTTQGEPS